MVINEWNFIIIVTTRRDVIRHPNIESVFISSSREGDERYTCSGVTKGPADPAVQGGAVIGGRQIVVWMWDNFENLTKVLAKLRVLL